MRGTSGCIKGMLADVIREQARRVLRGGHHAASPTRPVRTRGGRLNVYAGCDLSIRPSAQDVSFRLHNKVLASAWRLSDRACG